MITPAPLFLAQTVGQRARSRAFRNFSFVQMRKNSFLAALLGTENGDVSEGPPSEEQRQSKIREAQQVLYAWPPRSYSRIRELPEDFSKDDIINAFAAYEQLGIPKDIMLRCFAGHVQAVVHTLSTKQIVAISWAVFQLGNEANHLQSLLVANVLQRIPQQLSQCELEKLLLGYAHRQPGRLAMLHTRTFLAPRQKVDDVACVRDYTWDS